MGMWGAGGGVGGKERGWSGGGEREGSDNTFNFIIWKEVQLNALDWAQPDALDTVDQASLRSMWLNLQTEGTTTGLALRLMRCEIPASKMAFQWSGLQVDKTSRHLTALSFFPMLLSRSMAATIQTCLSDICPEYKTKLYCLQSTAATIHTSCLNKTRQHYTASLYC